MAKQFRNVMSIFMIVALSSLVWKNVTSIGIRPFSQATSSCPANVPTLLTKFGCACASVGQPCKCRGATCIGPGGSITGGIGTGSSKLGICACLPGAYHNATLDQCVQYLSISIQSGFASNCSFLNSSLTSSLGGILTASLVGGTPPYQFVLGVINQTFTGTSTSPNIEFSTTPLVNIDQNTGQVFVTDSPGPGFPAIPAVAADNNNAFSPGVAAITIGTVTQCLQVVAIDANNQASTPTSFCVTIPPFNPNCVCGAGTILNSAPTPCPLCS